MKKLYPNIIVFAFLSLISKEALANVSIGASVLLAYPALSHSSIIALVIAVSIESIVFHLIAKYHFIKSILLIFAANILSSLLGFIIAVCYSSGAMFFVAFFPAAWGLNKMLKYLDSKIQLPKYLLKFSLAIFIVLLWICLGSGIILLPLTDSYMNKHTAAPNVFVATFSSLIIISIGFLFTILSEAYVIVRFFSKINQRVDSSTLKGVLLMNLASYITLSAIYGPTVINRLFNK